MNVIIEIYIFVCIMLLLFNIVFLVTKNLKNKRYYTKKDKRRDMIKKELDEFDPETGFNEAFKDFLRKDIEKTKNMIILQNELDNITAYKQEIKGRIRPYILTKIQAYKEKTEYEQAYYAYVIASFEYGKENYGAGFYVEFLSFLEAKSLYVFANAMDAIYNFQDPYLVSEAIKKMDTRTGFYHGKLLIDGLLTIERDTEILHTEIIKNFYTYSNSTQESLLTYFRLKGAEVGDFCLSILKERQVHDEVLYAAMRYLQRFPNEEAKMIFVETLRNKEAFWVEELYAIKALRGYDEPLIKEVIKEKITNPNWHVRIGAISYLHKYILSKKEIFDILSLQDRYTNETLLYYYKDDLALSKYIIETSQMLNPEQEKTEGQLIEEPVGVAFSG